MSVSASWKLEFQLIAASHASAQHTCSDTVQHDCVGGVFIYHNTPDAHLILTRPKCAVIGRTKNSVYSEVMRCDATQFAMAATNHSALQFR